MNKLRILTIATAASTLVLTGCEHPNGRSNNTGTGALVGAGGGAALGATMTRGSNPAAGALFGGLFGAVTGSIIGNQVDQAQEAQLRAQAPVTYVRVQQGQSLTVSDIQALLHAKISEQVIIAQIQSSHSIFNLSSQDIISLHNSGASERLVNFMISTPNTVTPPAATVVMSDEPPPPPPEPMVVSPGPGYVWIPGQWQWNGTGWVWMSGQWVTRPWTGATWASGYWYRGPVGDWRYTGGHWR